MKSTIIIGAKIIFKMVPEECVQFIFDSIEGKSMIGNVFHNQEIL